jgi:hypothetical protein
MNYDDIVADIMRNHAAYNGQAMLRVSVWVRFTTPPHVLKRLIGCELELSDIPKNSGGATPTIV